MGLLLHLALQELGLPETIILTLTLTGGERSEMELYYTFVDDIVLRFIFMIQTALTICQFVWIAVQRA